MYKYIDKSYRNTKRWCPICGVELNPFDYYQQQEHRGYSPDETIQMWENEKLAIMCCTCFDIADYVENGRTVKDFLNDHGFDDTWVNDKMLENLEEFGLI